jgi:hypothetical protein
MWHPVVLYDRKPNRTMTRMSKNKEHFKHVQSKFARDSTLIFMLLTLS